MDFRANDPRYEMVNVMYKAGKIKFFRDIFKYIPKTRVSQDMGIKNDRWNVLADHLEEFDLKQMFTMCWLFRISERDMFELIFNEYMDKRAKYEKYMPEN